MAAAPSPLGQFPGLPGGGTAPPSVGGGNPLLGNTNVPSPQGPSLDQVVSGYMDQIRNISIQIDALAQQHPEASDDLGAAKQSLTDSMSKVAAAASAQQTIPQPPTF